MKRQIFKKLKERALIRPVGHLSHAKGTGEGDNLKQFCLLPFEEWEKVAEGRMRALWLQVLQSKLKRSSNFI